MSPSPDSVDSSSQPDNIFDGAPDPAPGAPLLSETDSKFLSSFFEDITSNQFNVPSFGEGLNFSDAWLDLPPQFMGSSTSFGQQEVSAEYGFTHDQQNDVSRIMPTESGLMPPPPPPPAASSQPHPFSLQHSDDVLNAAATLLQNGPRVAASKSPVASGSSSSNHTTDPHGRPQPAYPVGHLRHQPMDEFREESRRGSQGANVDQTLTRWMWGSKEQASVQRPILGDFQWGSDASFTDIQGYVPEPRKESVESMHQTQMKCLECLEVNKSAANTRPSSPVNGQSANSNNDAAVSIKREEDLTAPPRKRRKSKNVHGAGDEDDEDDADASSLGKPSRKRRTKSERSASESEPLSDVPPAAAAAAAASRRRKPVVNGAKAARENLTEEQKRENHIRSEQKRRTLIKEGFDDLGDLVPGLKSGGFSKSTILSMAAEWLDELLQGNKSLAMQLSNLERR